MYICGVFHKPLVRQNMKGNHTISWHMKSDRFALQNLRNNLQTLGGTLRFLYMHGLLVCGWCSLYMIFHAAREAYVGICNGTHAVAHSGHIRGMHRILQWNACTTAHASHEATVDRM